MGVNGIGASGYPVSYPPYKAEKNKPEEGPSDMSWTVKSQNHNVVLHGEESEEDGKVVSAWACVTENTSMTVYQPKDFDPENPVYKVKVWDADGNVTERMVDISKVNPGNCDTIDMYAYSAYLSKSGKCPDALMKFMSAHAHHKDECGNYTAANLFDKENWMEIVKRIMQMQYNAGNLKGYMDYKKFLSVLQEEKEKQEENDKKAEESKVETEVQVKPDGSRVLVMTRRMGGMTAITSMELSKPTSMPNDYSERSTEPEQSSKPEQNSGAGQWTVPDISNLSEELFGN